MKTVILKSCIAHCNGAVYSCIISGVTVFCKDCTQQDNCFNKTVTNVVSDVCPDCLTKILDSPEGVQKVCKILKR